FRQIPPDNVQLELLVVLRHAKTPEGWIKVQLSGVSSLRQGFFLHSGSVPVEQEGGKRIQPFH
ncbi:hypothetical protein, partial [Achromobacter mucicolens]|uniref:hypothetical protein n=1 Tax=Achromobacter mucicolens TaxID=1389922 RepID=UPI001C2E516A